MPKIRRVDLWAVMAVLGSTVAVTSPALPAQAVQRPVVAVRCEIPAPSLDALYGPLTRNIAAGLCTAVTKRLRQHRTLSIWQYEVGVASPAVLLFQVADNELGDTVLRVDLLLNGVSVRAEGPWERTWRSAADSALGNDPLPGEAAGVLDRAFAPLLQNAGLEERLRQKVPIAAGGVLMSGGSGPPRIVSPLPWQDFQRLRRSTFRISCDWPQKNDRAYLMSRGNAGPEVFHPDASSSGYPALVMIVSRREYEDELKEVRGGILQEVMQLKPKGIFLQQYEDPELEVFEP